MSVLLLSAVLVLVTSKPLLNDQECGTPSEGPVLKGVDVVEMRKTFLNDNSTKPVKGISDFSATYQGYNWWFVSEENKNSFMNDTSIYVPMYGGYDAYPMTGTSIHYYSIFLIKN